MKKILLITFLAFFFSCSLLLAEQYISNCNGGDCQSVNDGGAASVISQIHDMVEKKYAYNSRHKFAAINEPQGDTLTVYVPAGTTVHLRVTQLEAVTNDTSWTLFMNATSMVGDSGTTVTAIGNADSTGSAPASKWYLSGTMVGGTNSGYGGHLIADTKYFTGTDSANEEIILHAGLHYIYIEPSADSTVFHIRIHFYEPQ